MNNSKIHGAFFMSKNESEIIRRLDRIESILLDDPDDLIPFDEARRYLGLSVNALYEKSASKKDSPPEIAHFRRGKKSYYSKRELAAWLRGKKIHSREEVEQMAANI